MLDDTAQGKWDEKYFTLLYWRNKIFE